MNDPARDPEDSFSAGENAGGPSALTAHDRRSLSVIIPAYNEAARIGLSIGLIREYCEGKFEPLEIIVVDDGSDDGTTDIVGTLKQRMPHLLLLRLPVNQGKGAAVRAGMLAASSDLLLMCDADLSAPIEELEQLLPWIDTGAEVVIGSRALKESRIVRQPIYRHLMGKVFGVLARAFAAGGVRDPQCGFKLFTRKAAREIFHRARIDRFAFDAEALFLARKLGYAVREVGIIWQHNPGSRVRLIMDSLRMMMDLYRIRYNDRRGRYGIPRSG